MNNDIIKDSFIKDGKLTKVGVVAMLLVIEKAITLFFETLCDTKEKKNNE